MNNPEKITSKNETNEKGQQWEEMQKTIETIKGNLGNPVGKQVEDAVIGLNLLGTRTFMSGEGRMGDFRRPTAPFVDVESPEAPGLNKEYENQNGDVGYNEIEADEIRKIISQKNLETRSKLMSLLDEFYKGRQVSYDTVLTIESSKDNASHITNQGAHLQEINDDDTRKKNLARYQEEMKAFGKFLKEKYLAE